VQIIRESSFMRVGISVEEMQAARILTGTTIAAWLACGLIPAARPYATTIRVCLLAGYLLGAAVFIGYVMLR
jgi:hypothetical protein